MIYGQALLVMLGLLHALAAYVYFSKERHAARWTAAWLAVTALTLWQLPAYPLISTLAFGALIAAWTWWWESMQALATRNWIPEDERQATATLTGTQLTVDNLRNFTWLSSREFLPRWERRSCDLTKLAAVDLFVCTWGDPRIAHLIVSFVFSDTEPLAFSIEIRREEHEKWSMLAGFMKSYELLVIAADERDVIRVRTNVRGERVRRYRLVTTQAMREQMLMRYIQELNEAAALPRFYNTLYRNCTTEVMRILRDTGLAVPPDWRLIMPGYVPEYLYRHRLIATDRPFAQMQSAADIGELARAADADPAFSSVIRGGPGAN